MYSDIQLIRNENLFKNPTSAILVSNIENETGQLWLNQHLAGDSALLFTNYFGFLDGTTVEKATVQKVIAYMEENKISKYEIVCQNTELEIGFDKVIAIENILKGYECQKSERYQMDINMKDLNYCQLKAYANEIPKEYALQEITEEWYETAKLDQFLSNFVKEFSDYNVFRKQGFGWFLLDKGEVIAGVSSFIRYSKGIEVQIAVHPQYRCRHLARSLGAIILLKSARRELYPWWDCANTASMHIAEQLGYYLKRRNCTYRFTKVEKE